MTIEASDDHPLVAYLKTTEGRTYALQVDPILADLQWVEAPVGPVTLLQTALPEMAWRQIL